MPAAIVVVDNRSPNESLQALQDEFHGNDRVTVIDSGCNGGYSFGNNVGIVQLRQRGIKHVVIATSDTKVVSQNLFSRLREELDNGTGVIAPQICGSRGYQNPSTAKLTLKYILDIWWIQSGMPGLLFRRKLRHFLLRRGSVQKGSDFGKPLTPPLTKSVPRPVFKLHGAFLCLTESYLGRYEGFDDRIFLFCEEDLLAWQCLRSNLRQVLLEDILVEHDDDSSIEMTWGDRASEFVDKEQRRSGRTLKSEISLLILVREWFSTKLFRKR